MLLTTLQRTGRLVELANDCGFDLEIVGDGPIPDCFYNLKCTLKIHTMIVPDMENVSEAKIMNYLCNNVRHLANA